MLRRYERFMSQRTVFVMCYINKKVLTCMANIQLLYQQILHCNILSFFLFLDEIILTENKVK